MHQEYPLCWLAQNWVSCIDNKSILISYQIYLSGLGFSSPIGNLILLSCWHLFFSVLLELILDLTPLIVIFAKMYFVVKIDVIVCIVF
jgi:hypothetical protein